MDVKPGFTSAFDDDELFQELFMDAHTDPNIQNLTANQQIEDDPAWDNLWKQS